MRTRTTPHQEISHQSQPPLRLHTECVLPEEELVEQRALATDVDVVHASAARITYIGLELAVAWLQRQTAPVMQDGLAEIVATKIRITQVIIQPGIVYPGGNELLIPSNRLLILIIALGSLWSWTGQSLLESPIGLFQLRQLLDIG